MMIDPEQLEVKVIHMDQEKGGRKAPGPCMPVFRFGNCWLRDILIHASEYNFKNFNFRLLFYALALNVIGLLVINSAVNGDRSYINRQLIGPFWRTGDHDLPGSDGLPQTDALYRRDRSICPCGDPAGDHCRRTV